MKKKKKILITGSGGFIFGNFVRQSFYNKKLYNIASIDRVRESHIIQNIYVNSDHSFHVADIRDKHILHVLFQKEKPDIVIHGAAESNVDKSILNASDFVSSNILGTQNIIDECLDIGSKLIFISTDEVYGSLNSENEESWNEDSPINPRNPYSASKAAGELLVKAAGQTHGLKYNITRSCNNYGPWQTTEKLIPRVIDCILNDKEIPIYGQGNQVRDWIHVYDNCSALFYIIEHGKDNEIYNISAKQEFMNLEIVQEICNIFNKGYDLIKHVDDRPGHDFRYSITNDKIKTLGWNPSYKLKNGLKETCQWYNSNRYILNM